MTREEYLRQVAMLHMKWSKRYADQIPIELSVSAPHEGVGGQSDLSEHHHDVSAPAHYADLLDEKLYQLTREYQASGGR